VKRQYRSVKKETVKNRLQADGNGGAFSSSDIHLYIMECYSSSCNDNGDKDDNDDDNGGGYEGVSEGR
jgi:hypothetical protein